MILGVLAMVVANAATLLGARAMLSRIGTGRPAPDAVLFLVLRLLLISGAVIVAGLTRTLGPLGLGLAGAAALAALVARGAHRNPPRLRPLPWSPWLSLLAAIIGLRLLLQVWFFAPAYGDVLSYHLPKIAEWIRAGGFTRDFGPDPRSTFPAGFELIELWWTAFLHHDVLIEMAGLELLLLAGASVYALAREFGWSSSCAMAAAIAAVMIPGLHLQATACMNDGAVVAWIAATAALTAARVSPALILAAVALGAGTKPTFAFALPGLLCFAVLSRRDPAAASPGRLAPGIVSAGAMLVGSFWYVRNAIFFGNPIHPMGGSGMSSIAGLPLQRFGPSFGSLVDNVRSLLDLRVYDHLAPPSASHLAISNWGVMSFAVGFPALIYLARSEDRLRRLAVSFLVSLVCVWSLVVFDLFSARFVLFVPLVPALAAARLIERHRIFLPIAALALVFQFATTFLPAEISREAASRMARQSWRERTASPLPIEASAGRPIGYLSDYSGTPYWLYGPGFSTPVVTLRSNTLEGLTGELKEHRIRVIYLGELGDSKRRMMRDDERNGVLRSLGILVR
jgi:hypothetical protein